MKNDLMEFGTTLCSRTATVFAPSNKLRLSSYSGVRQENKHIVVGFAICFSCICMILTRS